MIPAQMRHQVAIALAGHPRNTTSHENGSVHHAQTQMLFFRAATQNAFTMVLAGLALTTTTLPNISRLPAFVAGFTRVLTMTKPGMVTLPTFFTCSVATAARLSMTDTTSFLFNSVSAAMASARPPLDKTLPDAFIAFIAFIALGAIVEECCGREEDARI